MFPSFADLGSIAAHLLGVAPYGKITDTPRLSRLEVERPRQRISVHHPQEARQQDRPEAEQ